MLDHLAAQGVLFTQASRALIFGHPAPMLTGGNSAAGERNNNRANAEGA
jgi:hypothetical protein